MEKIQLIGSSSPYESNRASPTGGRRPLPLQEGFNGLVTVIVIVIVINFTLLHFPHEPLLSGLGQRLLFSKLCIQVCPFVILLPSRQTPTYWQFDGHHSKESGVIAVSRLTSPSLEGGH
jgi:hypothetical protein